MLLANGDLDLCRFAENKAHDKNRNQRQDIEYQKQHQHGNPQPDIQVKDAPGFSRCCILVAVDASTRHVDALAHHDQLLLAPDLIRVDKRFQFTFGWRIGIGFFHETVFIAANTDYYSSIMLPLLKYFNYSNCFRVFSTDPLRILQPRMATSIVAETANIVYSTIGNVPSASCCSLPSSGGHNTLTRCKSVSALNR